MNKATDKIACSKCHRDLFYITIELKQIHPNVTKKIITSHCAGCSNKVTLSVKLNEK